MDGMEKMRREASREQAGLEMEVGGEGKCHLQGAEDASKRIRDIGMGISSLEDGIKCVQ